MPGSSPGMTEELFRQALGATIENNPMTNYVALLRKEPNSDYGMEFPDSQAA